MFPYGDGFIGTRIAQAIGASLVVQLVKNLCTVQETWVQSLAQKGPLKKEMATYSSILSYRIPWTEEPGRLSMRSKGVGHNWRDLAHTLPQGMTYLTYIQSMSCESRLWEKYQQLQIYSCTIMAENEEKLKSLLMKVKKESEKPGLKTQHSKN